MRDTNDADPEIRALLEVAQASREYFTKHTFRSPEGERLADALSLLAELRGWADEPALPRPPDGGLWGIPPREDNPDEKEKKK